MSEIDVRAANEKWEREARSYHVPMDPAVKIRCINPSNILLGPLTDKQIEKYRKLGYYSEAFKNARREYMEKKRNKNGGKAKREGNFLIYNDGRKVYAPL